MLSRIAASVQLAAMLLGLWVGAALAQAVTPDTFASWDQMAGRVQRVLEADRANDATLERLRGEVVEYRDRFLEAQNQNEDRVTRIQRQLAALGPAPSEGESEATEIAERRAALSDELVDLRQPILRASEAFVEADGLVSEIDRELRDRQASQVLKRYPVPLNPLHWTPVLAEFKDAVSLVPTEVSLILRDEDRRKEVLSNLPSAALSLLGGAFLVFRSRRWADWAARTVANLNSRPLARVLRLIVIMAQLGLPWMGLLLLLAALQLTGIFGDTGVAFLFAVGSFGFAFITGTWLVRHLFPKPGMGETPLRLSDEHVAPGRVLARIMVFTLSFGQGLGVFAERMQFDPQTDAYLGLILSFVTAFALFRIGQFFRKQDVGGDRNFADSVVSVLGALAMLFAVAGPLAGAMGYVVLCKQLIFPAAGTFFLFGLIALAQREVRELARLFGGTTATGDREEGLLPTLVGAALILGSIPLLALMWGARVTDLTEVWTKMREGLVIGDVSVSPTEFVAFVLVFAVGYGATRLIQGALRNTVLPKTRLDQGAQTALVSGVGYIGIFLAGLFAVTTAGIDLSNLAILASALAVGIGFGLQTIVSNFVSGIILLVERPVSEGDWIEVNGQMGYVRRISVRATRIETFDRTDVIVPNADLVSGQVTNWTRGNLIGRVIVPVGVAYGTDTRKVEKILMEIANAHPMVVISPPPSVIFMGFGADSMDFEIRAILRDINFMLSVKSDMNHEIARRFAEEGVEIPFAQRDIWLRNPEALRPAARMAPVAPEQPAMHLRGEDPDADASGDGDGDGDVPN